MGKIVKRYVALVGDTPIRKAPLSYAGVGLSVVPGDYGVGPTHEVVEHDSLGAAATTYIRYMHHFNPEFDLGQEDPEGFTFGARVRRYEEVSKLVFIREENL